MNSAEKNEKNPYHNVDYIYFKGRKHIYVMLNHRVAYLCWMDSFSQGFIKSNAFLVHVDWHTDYNLGSVDLIGKDAAIQDSDKAKFTDFVKNELRSDNSNFIVPAMYKGIIGDAVSIDKEDGHNGIYGEFKKMTYETTNRTEFKDTNGLLHTFYLGGKSIIELADYRGLLTDHCTHLDVQKAFNASARDRNLILDIDLDYFTYSEGGREWALNERNSELILESDGFAHILGAAKVITIALEPLCCGDSTECLFILNRLSAKLRTTLGVEIEKDTVQKYREELES